MYLGQNLILVLTISLNIIVLEFNQCYGASTKFFYGPENHDTPASLLPLTDNRNNFDYDDKDASHHFKSHNVHQDVDRRTIVEEKQTKKFYYAVRDPDKLIEKQSKVDRGSYDDDDAASSNSNYYKLPSYAESDLPSVSYQRPKIHADSYSRDIGDVIVVKEKPIKYLETSRDSLTTNSYSRDTGDVIVVKEKPIKYLETSRDSLSSYPQRQVEKERNIYEEKTVLVQKIVETPKIEPVYYKIIESPPPPPPPKIEPIYYKIIENPPPPPPPRLIIPQKTFVQVQDNYGMPEVRNVGVGCDELAQVNYNFNYNLPNTNQFSPIRLNPQFTQPPPQFASTPLLQQVPWSHPGNYQNWLSTQLKSSGCPLQATNFNRQQKKLINDWQFGTSRMSTSGKRFPKNKKFYPSPKMDQNSWRPIQTRISRSPLVSSPLSFSIPILESKNDSPDLAIPGYAILDSDFVLMEDFKGTDEDYRTISGDINDDESTVKPIPISSLVSLTGSDEKVEPVSNNLSTPSPSSPSTLYNTTKNELIYNETEAYAPKYGNFIPIVNLSHEIQPEIGQYHVEFSTGNGIKSKEFGYMKKIKLNDEKDDKHTGYGYTAEETGLAHVKVGSVSWLSPEGVRVSLSYTADENGYHPMTSFTQTNLPQENMSGDTDDPGEDVKLGLLFPSQSQSQSRSKMDVPSSSSSSAYESINYEQLSASHN